MNWTYELVFIDLWIFIKINLHKISITNEISELVSLFEWFLIENALLRHSLEFLLQVVKLSLVKTPIEGFRASSKYLVAHFSNDIYETTFKLLLIPNHQFIYKMFNSLSFRGSTCSVTSRYYCSVFSMKNGDCSTK